MSTTYVRRLMAAASVLLVGIGVGTVAAMPSGLADGNSDNSARKIVTIVLPGQISPGESDPQFPITVQYPPTEGVGSYTVPSGRRLVIESAWLSVNQLSDTEADNRGAVAGRIVSSYNLGADCAFPGFERDYAFTPTVSTVIDQDAFWSGSLQGPIYVEGGRRIQNGTTASYGQSTVIVFITIHGYLEPAVHPLNPPKPTCGP